jgi:hypothetical protein
MLISRHEVGVAIVSQATRPFVFTEAFGWQSGSQARRREQAFLVPALVDLPFGYFISFALLETVPPFQPLNILESQKYPVYEQEPGLDHLQGRDSNVHQSIQTGSGAHPASYTLGNGALSLEIKRPGREADQ